MPHKAAFFARVEQSRAKIADHLPGKHDQSTHGGGSYSETYGEVLDERSAGEDDQFVVAVTETGDMHVAFDPPGGALNERIVTAELISDDARALADELDWAHEYRITGNEASDDDGVIDSTGVAGRDDLEVLVYRTGDVGVRNTGKDDPGPASGFDMGSDEASDLSLALNQMADFYDEQFG